MPLEAPGPGRVIWITGLSGAGKTTVGSLVYDAIRAEKPNVVYLDGDVVRKAVEEDLGHSREDRRKSGLRKGRLCNMLAVQGIDVVCSTISLFHDCHRWNRENIARYCEVYLRVPLDILMERDSKGIYHRPSEGEVQDVWGIDIAVEEPLEPDLVLDNSGVQGPKAVAGFILQECA